MILNANNNTYINTTNIIYDEKNNKVELAEGSKININNTNILVDKGIIDYNNDTVEIFGNFYLYQDLNILSGKDLIGNTKLDNFQASKVSFIYNNDLKIDSNNVERKDDIVYFYNNFLTPCKLEGYFNCPTWSLRIDETRYDITKDKFNHFDTFLQIADYKLFYMPYFSHYGVKAPRQKGFLTPTLSYNLGGDTAVITPYYLPIGDKSDVLFKPKLTIDSYFGNFREYELRTIINHKNTGGDIFLEVHNKKFSDNSKDYSSLKFRGNQTLDKKNIISYKALLTNSVSTTRSINDESLTFEDIFIRLDSYDILYKSDYLRTEISTVEALDTTKSSFIPLSPSIKYLNQKLTNNNLSFKNEINIINLNRVESSLNKPSESFFLQFDNSLSNSFLNKNSQTYNKINLINNFSDYSYQHDSSLNDSVYGSYAIFSSDTFFNLNKNIKPRLKFVKNLNLISDNLINEDSNAITFNYQNQFSDSRLYGNDLEDNTSRLIYGLENNFIILDRGFDVNINQSYDFKSKTNYTNQINQNSNLSDIAIEAKTSTEDLFFKIDSRIDKDKFEKKEMNYNLGYSDKFELNLDYNETESNSFRNLSSDTKSLGLNIGKGINDNISVSISSNLDLKNDYSPFTQSIKLSLFDECSRLDVTYTDERFNDNYNTKPNETLSISFYMDYLGFFQYEQKSNLFFEEPGNINYGM